MRLGFSRLSERVGKIIVTCTMIVKLFHLASDRLSHFFIFQEDLPGKYSFENRGGLFVAAIEDENKDVSKVDQIIGCIAIRPLEESCGEVKRMYIRKDYRRFGIGSMLAKSIISHAWDVGYTEIKLDSLERLVGAVKLYESFGFQRIDPYCECPEDDHVCMNVYK